MMTLPMPAPLVTRRELADALGCHMQTVTKYEREGMPIAKRGDRGKPSLYQPEDVRAWLAQRADGAQAPVAAIELADVRDAWVEEIAAIRALLLSRYASGAGRVHRAAAQGVAGVARELQAITAEILRALAAGERPASPVAVMRPARPARASMVADTLRQARALYAPPAPVAVPPPPDVPRPQVVPPTPVGRRVARSQYLGR